MFLHGVTMADDEEEATLLDVRKHKKHKRDYSSSAPPCCSPSRWMMIACATITSIVFLFAISLGIGLGVTRPSTSPTDGTTYQHAAVATDAEPCSRAGVDILKKGGSAVDAAIASTLCVGVVNLHSTGIGGGGFMVYYNGSSGEAYALDFREKAPINASTFMYNKTAPDASSHGGLAIAVPGELHGLDAAWRKFGKLDWKELFEPAVKLAQDGFPVSKTIAGAIQAKKDLILSGNYSGLEELLAPNGHLLQEGDELKQPQLAETLQQIAEHGIDYFYNSSFTEKMVEELQRDYGSIITLDDFRNYSSVEREVARAKYKGQEMVGVSPPAGGVVLGLILNILDHYNFSSDNFGTLSYHRIVEAFKFSYAQRLGLGDPDYNTTVHQVAEFMLDPSTAMEMFLRIDDNVTHEPAYYTEPLPLLGAAAHDHGTSHLCVLAENGDAVALTSTINSYFGSLVRSQTSGIIFNDEMDDFSIPGRDSDDSLKATEPNYIKPGKRPLSSTTPTILVAEDGSVKMVVGASGGSKITTAVAQVVLDVLGFHLSLDDAIKLPRLHHQLFPNQISAEKSFPESYRNGLKDKGHEIVESSSGAVVQGVYVNDDGIHAECDSRKGGLPDGY